MKMSAILKHIQESFGTIIDFRPSEGGCLNNKLNIS